MKSVALIAVLMLTAVACSGGEATVTPVAAEPSVEQQPAPTSAPQIEPTAVPAPTSTPEPTAVPTPEPTVTPEPTPEPTATPALIDDRLIVFSPALDSPDLAIVGWTQMVETMSGVDPDDADLAPTITADDVSVDPSTGLLVFVEQVTPGTIFGGVADPDTEQVIGFGGFTDTDSGEVGALFQIVWTVNYGLTELGALTELLDVEVVQALAIGDQLSFSHLGKTAVLQHLAGANPDDGLYFFTVADDNRSVADPRHDVIIDPMLAALLAG